MITQKTKYALKALMALAAQEKGKALTIEEVAQRADAPKRFLEHILLDLRKAGYVEARRGRSGGYLLIRPPQKISLGEVLGQLDGPIAPLPCLSRRAYRKCDDCRDEASCSLRRVFAEVFYSYLLLIESLTLQDLVAHPALAEGPAMPGFAEQGPADERPAEQGSSEQGSSEQAEEPAEE